MTSPTSVPFTQEMTFSTYTAEQGQTYAQVRLDYHPQVYQTIIDHHISTSGKLDTLLDVGCGPGNVTRAMAPHFAHAIGLDPSEGMLATARAASANVFTTSSSPLRFEVSTAEELGTKLPSDPIRESSVDLITAANAAHWFDMSGFWPAAARVLKPGGTVALWTSGSVRAHPSMPNAEAINAAIDAHNVRYLTPYTNAGNLLARDSYINLPLPWTLPSPVPEFDQQTFRRVDWDPMIPFHADQREVSLEVFEMVFGTSSAVTRWREANPKAVGTEDDVLKILTQEVARLLHEKGVERGEERVKGTVQGAILFVKKRG